MKQTLQKTLPLLVAMAISPAVAQETRQLDAHEHGVGELNIAIDGTTVAIEFFAPGADIVGFEYQAESAEDRALIDDAVATLARPLELFVMPAAAECTVIEASAKLESEEEHAEHADHGDEHGDEHADHADHGDEHAEEHADHGHEHAGHGDEHAEHAEEAEHTEFHAEYVLSCADPAAITDMRFVYFETFENALELEVQLVTADGAQSFEVERAAPVLDLRGLL
ncbi:MAG: DUF2796 domain-containing protein [Pseudomonadota bacterium]